MQNARGIGQGYRKPGRCPEVKLCKDVLSNARIAKAHVINNGIERYIERNQETLREEDKPNLLAIARPRRVVSSGQPLSSIEAAGTRLMTSRQ